MIFAKLVPVVLVGVFAGCGLRAPSDGRPSRMEPGLRGPDRGGPPRVASTVHGELAQTEDGRVLRLWGTPQQMGQAHGQLLRAEILDVVDHYALDAIPPAVLDGMGPLYETVAQIPEPLRQEAAAIVDGMKLAGGAYSHRLGRDLEPRDLLVLNAMTDLLAIGCSSVSAWGDATADGELAGAPAMVRNLDWAEAPALLRNQVVIVYEPSDEDRQSVVSVSFAGYIGCLSCMNRAGVVAAFNMGYGEHAATALQAAGGFAPANLLLRDALERRDPDQDGHASGADVEAAVREARHAGSYIVHVLDPEPGMARILEVEADGVAVRHAESATTLGGHVLAATNHFRDKDEPSPCRRYRTIERRVARADGLDRDTLWRLGIDVRLPQVVHTVLFEPRTGAVRVWLRHEDEAPAHDRPGLTWQFDRDRSAPAD